MGAFDRQPHGKGAGKIDAPLPVDLALHDEGLPVHLLQRLWCVCVAIRGHVRHIIRRIDRAQPKTQGPACCGVHHHTTKAESHHHIYIKSNPQPPKPPQTQAPRALLAFLTRLARCTSKGVISAMLEPELILVWWVQGMVCVCECVT